MTPSRIERLIADLRAANLGALVVTHPANIKYLTGLDASSAAALVSDDGCTLIVDFRYLQTAESIANSSRHIHVLLAAKGLDVAIAAELRKRAVTRAGIEAAHLQVARYNRLSVALAAGTPLPLDAQAPMAVLVPTERFVEQHRAIKDEHEINTIREAARRLAIVARQTRGFVQPGRSERDVASMVNAALTDAGFQRPAFETIVASGPNSALPHARPTSRVLAEGEGVLLDFGGVYDGYCVDLTRTLHIGPWGAEFRRLFEAVAEAHRAAIAAVKPGALAADIDGAARRVLERRGLGEAFGHGTGHGLGLEVHEEPRISPLAAAGEQVAAGMVFTIEPGAYLPGVGGVRIEDDVLVTETGCELLTDVAVEL